MLLNILHTIAITCAVGTNFYTGRAIHKPSQNREMVNRSVNLQYSGNNYSNNNTVLYTNGTAKTTAKLDRTDYNGNTNDLHVRAVNVEEYVMYDPETELNLIAKSQNINAVKQVNFYSNWFDTYFVAPTLQYLVAIEIDSAYGFTDVNINISMDFNKPDETITDIEYLYIEAVSTTDSLNYMFNAPTQQIPMNLMYLYSNNLYDRVRQVELDLHGYNTSINQTYERIEEKDEYMNEVEVSMNVSYTHNKKNYYLFYLQPIYQVATTPSTPYYADYYGIYQDNIEITISGKQVITSGTIEVVDIGGTMYQVVGMPFAFISTAFNMTLFPGTAYEINISTLFLSIFAVIVFVFLVKIIIGAINRQ